MSDKKDEQAAKDSKELADLTSHEEIEPGAEPPQPPPADPGGGATHDPRNDPEG